MPDGSEENEVTTTNNNNNNNNNNSSSSSPPPSSSSTVEQSLINAIGQGSLQSVVQIVTTQTINLNCIDEHGMSPLQHACYKGHTPIVKFLLEHGADVNQNEHEHGYSALMFAALGGHVSSIQLLLEYGANVSATNSVGRNASQMAGFVGQHRSVSAINNYINRDLIEYYSRITGVETTPRLSVRLIQPVLGMVRMININPIRIVFYLKTNLTLLDDSKMITNVLSLLSEKFIRSNEPKEMLSLKIHYLKFILEQIEKVCAQAETLSDPGEKLDNLIKFWLKTDSNGFPINIERLLRQCIRTYRFTESSLFQQLVQTLSSVEVGDEPSALSLLSQAILGKGQDNETNICFTCAEMDSTKRCSQCKVATYCDETCQRLHWRIHKRHCDQLRKQRLDSEQQQQQSVTSTSVLNEGDQPITKPIDEEKLSI